MRANLMRELSKMEWADVLSGQVDRHGDNYLIDINPQTGAVKITGIDNDASFGTRKTGMTVVDLSRPTPRQQDFLNKLRREGYTIPPDGRIDLSKLPDRLLSETRQQFGFNQLFRPVLIDRDTFDKLTAIREDDYRAMLAPCMDNEAVDAAVSRLKDAQRHAARLEREHRVVEDWNAPGIKETYTRHKVGAHPERFLYPGLSGEVQRHPLIRGCRETPPDAAFPWGCGVFFYGAASSRHERGREISQIPEGT